ncbi:serine hydrolase domain-containing protein [Aerococcaceae bacterium WGS1372]
MYRKLLVLTMSVLTLSVVRVNAMSQPSDGTISLIEEALAYGSQATISLGYIEDGQSTYYVYQDGQSVEEGPLYNYEVGSITKTVTAAMVARAVEEGKIQIDNRLNDYIPSLDQGLSYPTIQQLLTHQSGYPTLFDNDIIIENLRMDLNPYHGVSKDMLLEESTSQIPEGEAHDFEYSNVNASLLALVLEAVYGYSYAELVADFISEDLALTDTRLSNEEKDLMNQWEWSVDDAYAPAAAMISNIADMLAYSQVQLDEGKPWVEESHRLLAKGNPSSSETRLSTDQLAYHWFYDEGNQLYWHDGGTGGYTSYIGFNLDQQKAVVVLSNVPMDQGIPASIIGSQMLTELLQ